MMMMMMMMCVCGTECNLPSKEQKEDRRSVRPVVRAADGDRRQKQGAEAKGFWLPDLFDKLLITILDRF
jgi:hypothetical protein